MIPWTIPGDGAARAAAPDVRSHPAAAAPPPAWRRPDGAGRAGGPRALRAAGFRPGHAIPGRADRTAGLRLAAGLRAVGGTVATPADPVLAVMAGLPAVEDQFAAVDVLRATDPSAKATFTRSVARAVATRRFSIITELDGDLRGFSPELPRYYHRCPQVPLLGIPPAPFRKSAAIQPVPMWLPVGHGSGTAAARALTSPPAADLPTRPGTTNRSGASR